MQSSSWMTSNNSNLPTNNSNFWSNGGFRKRKAASSDLDDKTNQKIFVTEEKMVKEMQTLSLDFSAITNNNNNNIPISISEPIIEEIQSPKTEDDSSDDEKDKNTQETRFELHKLLRERLKDDDLQDNLLRKLCEIERKKVAMQIVPYMPIHPAQLNKDSPKKDDKKTDDEKEEDIKDENLFKIPSIPSTPTPYTVEEPCDNVTKRPPTMKRSYSQSNQYNSNLSVTELKPDAYDYSIMPHLQSAYFIVEPTAAPLYQTSSNTSSSSLSSGGPSVRITEFVDNPVSNNDFTSTIDDDDIDMQSVASSDTGDKMDDD